MKAKAQVLSTVVEAVIFLFLSAAFVAAQPAAPIPERVIRIGVLASLTDEWMALGNSIVEGVRLAAEESDRSSGLRYEIVVQDTEEAHSGAKAIEAFRSLRQQGVELFIGPVGTPGGMALAPIIQRDKRVLIVTPTVGVRAFSDSSERIFNSRGLDEVGSRLTAELAIQKGVQSVAVIGSEHPWEDAQARAFSARFSELGGQIRSHDSPPSDTNDVRPILIKIMQQPPEAVFLANFNRIPLTARQLRQLGYSGELFAVTLDGARVVQSRGALNGANFYNFELPSSTFLTRYKSRFGREPQLGADSAFDAMRMLDYAIRESRAGEAVAMSKVLTGATIEGCNGSFVIGSDRIAKRSMQRLAVRDGKIVLD
ncbi:MAG: ABC transporter substrate-binding protein [Oligoflexia bacterium]|nr:ABC transporter substrate-binding protein [Oligoflexia bacterium]